MKKHGVIVTVTLAVLLSFFVGREFGFVELAVRADEGGRFKVGSGALDCIYVQRTASVSRSWFWDVE